ASSAWTIFSWPGRKESKPKTSLRICPCMPRPNLCGILITKSACQGLTLSVPHMDIGKLGKKAELLEQPKHHGDHHHGVQYLLYLGVHRNVGVYEPEQHTHHNQYDDQRNQRHVIRP